MFRHRQWTHAAAVLARPDCLLCPLTTHTTQTHRTQDSEKAGPTWAMQSHSNLRMDDVLLQLPLQSNSVMCISNQHANDDDQQDGSVACCSTQRADPCAAASNAPVRGATSIAGQQYCTQLIHMQLLVAAAARAGCWAPAHLCPAAAPMRKRKPTTVHCQNCSRPTDGAGAAASLAREHP